ncbi:MAG: hypothetical protein HY070_13600 [Chloroflexi bacterium]|nr:hypothetical protein [Chloroflexota bacterium]
MHFEADKRTNDSLFAFFNARALELRAELNPRIEVERWTESWSRVHQVVPYIALDEKLVDQVARELAQMIIVLEPMLKRWRKKK